MRITDVRIHLLRLDRPRAEREMFVIPGQLRMQFDRRSRPGREADQAALIRIVTDAGIEGWCNAFYTFGPARALKRSTYDRL